MVFQRAMLPEDPPVLFESFVFGSLPTCELQTTANATFVGIPNNTAVEGFGQADVGPCEWGSPWTSSGGVVRMSRITFITASNGLYATRFISPLTNAGLLSFSARMLDLCRVIDQTEPLDDNVGYCRALGKIITMSLCASDDFCITFGVATDRNAFLYRLGYFNDPLNFAGFIPRPMVTSYPLGLYFQVDVDEQLKVTFSYGPSLSELTVLATDFYLPSAPSLSQFTILRFVMVTPNNEPGVALDDILVTVSPPSEAPLFCDGGEYLAEGACRHCPANTSSPLGSTSMTACVCMTGQYLASCVGDTACEDSIGREDFEFLRFTDFSNLRLQYNATVSQGNSVRLTPSQPNSLGQLFYRNPLDLQVIYNGDVQEASFTSHFVFLINGNGGGLDEDGPGADGLAFVMTPALPGTGNGGEMRMGYQGITPSVVVEIDTFQNDEDSDLSGNHVGINVNGNLRSLTQKNISPLFNNGTSWHCWVDYDATNQVLEVRVSQQALKPVNPDVSLFDSVARILGTNRMYIGLTASTSMVYSSHYILSWDFDTTYQDSCTCEKSTSFFPWCALLSHTPCCPQLACPQNMYKDTYGNQMCEYCPLASFTSSVGASSLDDCLCFPGYEWLNSTCAACPADFYSPDADSLCVPCPANATTAGEIAMTSCRCNSGFFMTDLGECVGEDRSLFFIFFLYEH